MSFVCVSVCLSTYRYDNMNIEHYSNIFLMLHLSICVICVIRLHPFRFSHTSHHYRDVAGRPTISLVPGDPHAPLGITLVIHTSRNDTHPGYETTVVA